MRVYILTLFALALPLACAHKGEHTHHHAEEGHHHHHHSLDEVEVTEKFTPTEDLKVRMDKMPGLIEELQKNKKDKKAVRASGEKFGELVHDIFENCDLEPEPDAALHPVLATILMGSEELKKGHYNAGEEKIQEGLSAYGRFFDHKDWPL